jgi:hypothetical protein
MLHKDYDRKCSVFVKISGRDSQGAWRYDELIGGKPPFVKYLWLIKRSFVMWPSVMRDILLSYVLIIIELLLNYCWIFVLCF